MSNAIAIITNSGFGKTTSLGVIPELGIKGLNPKETLLINVKGKPLPFRGWKKMYSPINMSLPPTTGNYLETTNHADIIKIMSYFNTNRPEIKTIVIDDSQYLMAEEFMVHALKSGYEKYSKLAKNMYDVINIGIKLRHDLNFIIMCHEEETKDGSFKMKTIGKMLDDKVTLEGLFTIILYGKSSYDASTKKTNKQFITNFDGTYPAKSPVGMFTELYVPNDMGFIVDTVTKYYNGE